MDHGFGVDGCPVLFQQLLHGIKDKVDLQAPAEDVREYLRRKGVLDHGQIAELPVVRYIGDVRQEHGARPVLAELTLQQVVRHGIRLQAPGHAPVRVRFPDRTGEAVFPHQPADLLVVHPDTHPEEPHVDAHDALVIAAERVGFPDQEEVPQVPYLAEIRPVPAFAPAVVAGTGDTCKGAQQLDT